MYFSTSQESETKALPCTPPTSLQSRLQFFPILLKLFLSKTKCFPHFPFLHSFSSQFIKFSSLLNAFRTIENSLCLGIISFLCCCETKIFEFFLLPHWTCFFFSVYTDFISSMALTHQSLLNGYLPVLASLFQDKISIFCSLLDISFGYLRHFTLMFQKQFLIFHNSPQTSQYQWRLNSAANGAINKSDLKYKFCFSYVKEV